MATKKAVKKAVKKTAPKKLLEQKSAVKKSVGGTDDPGFSLRKGE